MSGSAGNNKLGNNGGRFYSFPFQPVLIDCNFVIDSTNGNGLGVRNLKGEGVQSVFMHTSATFTADTHTTATLDNIAGGTASLKVGMPVSGTGIPAGAKIASIPTSGSVTISPAATATNASVTVSYAAVGSPNPAAGYAFVHLANSYAKYLGGFSGFVSPSLSGTSAINATALTLGSPYVIATVGHGTAGTVTIAPVADSSGSLASTWFSLYDGYGNTYIIWFSVSGVGSAPVGVSGTLVQQSIVTNETAANVGTKLAVTLNALLAAQPGNPSAPSGVFSFTATGTTTVTVVSTLNSPLPGGPAEGLIATGFTFAVTKSKSNLQNWQNVGLPSGVVPAVGASFFATSTGDSTLGGSTGTVVSPTPSGSAAFEVVGDPNQSVAPIPVGGSPNVGSWLMVSLLSPEVIAFTGTTHTNTTLDTLTPTNPISAGVRVGMNVTGVGIPLGTTVAGVSATAITLSAAATASTSGVAITVGPAMVPTAPVDGSVLGMSFWMNARV